MELLLVRRLAPGIAIAFGLGLFGCASPAPNVSGSSFGEEFHSVWTSRSGTFEAPAQDNCTHANLAGPEVTLRGAVNDTFADVMGSVVDKEIRNKLTKQFPSLRDNDLLAVCLLEVSSSMDTDLRRVVAIEYEDSIPESAYIATW